MKILYRIRCTGEARFTIWGVIRWLLLRRYRAKFSFTKENVNLKGFEDNFFEEKNNDWVHIDGFS